MPLRQTPLNFGPANTALVKRELNDSSDELLVPPSKRRQQPALVLVAPVPRIVDRVAPAQAPPPTRGPLQRSSREMVVGAIRRWIRALGGGHRFVGPLGGARGDEMVMPLSHGDGRKLTWEKFAGEASSPPFLKLGSQN
jgi:hypothetical protein